MRAQIDFSHFARNQPGALNFDSPDPILNADWREPSVRGFQEVVEVALDEQIHC